MTTRQICCALLLLVLACGCDSGEGGSPPPAQPATPAKVPVDHPKSLPVQTKSLEEMTFAHPELGRKLRSFDAAAKGFFEGGHHYRPYKTLAPWAARGVYLSQRATFSLKGRNPVNYRGPREVHAVSLSAFFDYDNPDNGDEIKGIALDAKWKPQGGGWAAMLDYSTFHGEKAPRGQPHREDFRLIFEYHTAPGEEGPGYPNLRLHRSGTASYQTHYLAPGEGESGGSRHGTWYEIRVRSPGPRNIRELSREVPDDDVRRILKTPKSLRRFALEVYERLEERIQEEFRTGRAIESARIDRKLEYGEDPGRLDSDRPMTEEEKKEVLDKALRDVRLKQKIVREQYEDLHAAAVQAFPIVELLQEADRKGNKD